MKVKLVTKDKKDPNNKLYITSTEFFIQELLGKSNVQNIEIIYVNVQAQFGHWGECYVKYLANGNRNVRIKFKKNLNLIESLITLAHECVHVKQFIKHELIIDSKGIWWWKGKSYGVDPYANLTVKQYYTKLPWEKEALRKENTLVLKYLQHYFSNIIIPY